MIGYFLVWYGFGNELVLSFVFCVDSSDKILVMMDEGVKCVDVIYVDVLVMGVLCFDFLLIEML